MPTINKTTIISTLLLMFTISSHAQSEDAQLKRLFNEMDGNSDGQISWPEFERYQALQRETAQRKATSPEAYKQRFAAFDKDKDGFLSPVERKTMPIVKQIGDKKLMEAIDKNGDNKLEFFEYLSLRNPD